jgi:hypothetical protein
LYTSNNFNILRRRGGGGPNFKKNYFNTIKVQIDYI